ncbi:hypothetical protein HMPREF1549_03273 [Actinomyces johnsonii F0510]|uniref:Uncharacterized protein n=1 Tax=Actinomyces johnsonii F0510 TaxID=1227262 RepID=U1PZM0_9ACTO|nr:DUF5691 domain-containing protein [Actinomyces johnsonii]ERH15464.1 hypothetical protein HMPREF1549_03273 [Actinomyces johnsonii F0510]
MSDLSPLAQTAVIGTSTRPFSPGTLPSAVTSALPPRRRGAEGAGDTEDTSEGTDALLDAAAAYGAVHRATIPTIPSSAARDTGWAASSRPLAPEALRPILEQILLSRPQEHLLATALGMVAECGWRLPAPLLMRVLNETAYRHEDRDAVLAVVDERTAAVLRDHPVWGKRVEPLVSLPGGDSGDDSVWRLGTTTQRLAYFRRLRAQDPAAARTLMVASWKKEKAEARRGIVEALATGLGEADLPLLEMAITDRSGGVRQAAAQVLLHLPESGLVQRAEALAASHMSVTKRFLRTTRVDCRPIEVTDEVLRDEYGERGTGNPSRIDVGPPSARRTAAGYPPALLEEVVGRVPIDRWPALIGLSAGQLLEAEVTFEGEPLDLSSALFTADRRGSGALIEACTADAFKRGDLDRFTDMRRFWPRPYSAEHSRRMVSFLRSALGSHRPEDIGYWTSQETTRLPVSCHATVLPEALALMEEVSRPDSAPAFVTDAVEGLRLRLRLEALRTHTA